MAKAKKKSMGLTTKIMTAMALGILSGLILNAFIATPFVKEFIVDGILITLGNIFIATLKVLVVPLVFFSLICGSAALDDVQKLGRIGGKTIGYFLGTTAVAVAMALLLAVFFDPGAGFHLDAGSEFHQGSHPGLATVIEGIFPSNIIQAMADANMMQIIVFSILFGFAIALTKEKGKRVLRLCEDINEIIMKIVSIVMHFAPIGVFSLIAHVFASQGASSVVPLMKYLILVLALLFVQQFVVYSLLLKFVGKLSPMMFFKKMRPAMLFGFSTSSSSATLPVSLETVEHRLGVNNSIASFAVPLGATINMDGTAIMQGVATIFIAGAYGIQLGMPDYLMVILTATLASVGTAGVPGVGMITLAMVLKQAGLPTDGIGLILGIDRIIDMFRTTVNITGDCVVSCLVAKSENQLSQKTYDNPDADIPVS